MIEKRLLKVSEKYKQLITCSRNILVIWLSWNFRLTLGLCLIFFSWTVFYRPRLCPLFSLPQQNQQGMQFMRVSQTVWETFLPPVMQGHTPAGNLRSSSLSYTHTNTHKHIHIYGPCMTGHQLPVDPLSSTWTVHTWKKKKTLLFLVQSSHSSFSFTKKRSGILLHPHRLPVSI